VGSAANYFIWRYSIFQYLSVILVARIQPTDIPLTVWTRGR